MSSRDHIHFDKVAVESRKDIVMHHQICLMAKLESTSCKIALALFNNFHKEKSPISSRLVMSDYFHYNTRWCPRELRELRSFSQVLFAMVNYWKFCLIDGDTITWLEEN